MLTLPCPRDFAQQRNPVKPRITYAKFNPAGEKKTWRPQKTKDPDCASYENGKAKDFVGRSPFIHKFAAPKEEGAKQSKETYTTIISR